MNKFTKRCLSLLAAMTIFTTVGVPALAESGGCQEYVFDVDEIDQNNDGYVDDGSFDNLPDLLAETLEYVAIERLDTNKDGKIVFVVQKGSSGMPSMFCYYWFNKNYAILMF